VYRGGLAANPTGTVYAAVTGGNGSRFVLNVLKRDWGTNMSLSAQASQLLLGDGVHVSGVLSAGDSTFPGQELTVQRTLSGGAPVTLPSMTTDEFGAFAFDDVPDTAGSYSYQVHYAPDVEHQQITKAVEVTVNKHPVALTPWAVKPSRTLVNEPFQVSSTLSAAGAPMPNRELSITRTNPDGSVEDLTTVTTDAHGSFHFNDSRPAGSYTYRATFQGDSFYAALSRTAVVRVLRHASNVQLGRLPAVVDAGTKIAVVATLSGTSGEISIRAQSGVGPAVTVATGSVDDGGSLRLEHIVHQNTTFTATFEASATHAMDTAQGTVLAATEVKATLRRYHRVVRRGEPDMHIYSRGVVPALIGKVLPAHPRYCVDLRLQAWDGRAWTSRDEWCAMLAADSTFRTEFPAPLRPGRYRLQGQFDDDDHAIGRLSPLYLRVER
jgi:hypothetical protein